MINQEIYLKAITEMSEHFKKELSPLFIKAFYKKLTEQLSTDEFLEAAEKAIVDEKFFPTATQLIDSILGTLEERAEREWQDIDSPFSHVGLKALNAIGGWWYVKNQCTQPAIARKDFIESYCRHGKDAPRQDFEIPKPSELLLAAQPDRQWSYLPIGTKRNKITKEIETRWQKIFLDELFPEQEITDEIRNTWVATYLDNYAARNIRLVDGIHAKANADVPNCWENYALPNIQWLNDRARLYLLLFALSSVARTKPSLSLEILLNALQILVACCQEVRKHPANAL